MTGERLAGHTLQAEGRAYEWGYRRIDGKGICSCGATSRVLGSDSARRQWHRDHKTAIRAGATQP
jgi:hypothetical protein